MKNKIIALLIGALTVMPVAAFAKGPYKSLAHRKDVGHILTNFAGDALDIKNKNGEKFVQWYRGDHYVCQCTDGMNLDAIASKQSEGWQIWHPSTTDPRYEWCPNHEFIYKIN